jgi:hypothetical protein
VIFAKNFGSECWSRHWQLLTTGKADSIHALPYKAVPFQGFLFGILYFSMVNNFLAAFGFY